MNVYNWNSPEDTFGGDTSMYMTEHTQCAHGGLLPEVLANPLFIPGFLARNTGKIMRVEFLVGNSLNDRSGRLLAVGAGYILLESLDSASQIMCDMNSIRFAAILDPDNQFLPIYQESAEGLF